MKIYLIFTHDWDGLEFHKAYSCLDAAVEYALKLHMSVHTEVHETELHDFFSFEDLSGVSTRVLWTSQTHSGAI